MSPDQLLEHFDRISDAPGAVARLRQFILELAVRGKLLPQESNDTSSLELLGLSDSSKDKALALEGVRKREVFEEAKESDFSFPIPKGWLAVRLGRLAIKLGAGSTPLGGKSVYQTTGIPFLRSQNVYNDGLRLDDVALITKATHDKMSGTYVRPKDLLLNITGASIGRCAIVPNSFREGNVSQHVAIVRLALPEIGPFIHLSLISPIFQRLIDDVQVGVSREGLSMQRLRQFAMPLPPLAEQKRIVAKVDELMGLCDRLEAAQKEREDLRDKASAASLARLSEPAEEAATFREYAEFHLTHLPRFTTRPDQIPQMRQTILNLAIRGKLVTQDQNDEPTSILFDKIQAEILSKQSEGTYRRFEPLPEIASDETPYDLPTSWKWIRLRNLVFALGDGLHGTPEYMPGSKCYFINGNNLVNGKILIKSNTKEVSLASMQKHKKSMTQDTVLVSINGTLGNVAFYDNENVVLGKSACYFHLPSFLSKDYIRRIIESPYFSAYANRNATGTTILNLGLKAMNNFPIPLPPLAEQKRVVAKVDELMALCDQLEASLATQQTENARLLEAILHEALAPA